MRFHCEVNRFFYGDNIAVDPRISAIVILRVVEGLPPEKISKIANDEISHTRFENDRRFWVNIYIITFFIAGCGISFSGFRLLSICRGLL